VVAAIVHAGQKAIYYMVVVLLPLVVDPVSADAIKAWVTMRPDAAAAGRQLEARHARTQSATPNTGDWHSLCTRVCGSSCLQHVPHACMHSLLLQH